MLITDDDNPETDDVHVRSIRRHARDLAATGNATMELFPISLPGTTFDMSKFWQDVVFRSDSEEDDMAVEGASRSFRDLEDRIRRKADRKRSYMRVPFTLGSGMTIGVRGYSLIMEQKRPAHLNVRSDSNEPVKSKQILVSRETAEPLPPDEIEYAFTYGFERVTFTKDEIAQIKNFGPPGIRLLGFKPKSAIKIHHTLKHSIFLFPDEKVSRWNPRLSRRAMAESAHCRSTRAAQQSLPPSSRACSPTTRLRSAK